MHIVELSNQFYLSVCQYVAIKITQAFYLQFYLHSLTHADVENICTYSFSYTHVLFLQFSLCSDIHSKTTYVESMQNLAIEFVMYVNVRI